MTYSTEDALVTLEDVHEAITAASIDLATELLEAKGITAPDEDSKAYDKYSMKHLGPTRESIVKMVMATLIGMQVEKLTRISKTLYE